MANDQTFSSTFEEVSNYYELLVRKEITDRGLFDEFDMGTVSDIACTALNELPSKYIRSTVNLLFYLSDEERQFMETAVKAAVAYALAQVAKRGH